MRIVMLTRYSPEKGKTLHSGAVVDVPDEVAIDMVQRGLASVVKTQPERAVGPGQVQA
jgi:hypothetical protein